MPSSLPAHESDGSLRDLLREADDYTPPSSMTFLSGMQERYIERNWIGEGAVKNVFKSFDERTKKFVAIAELKEDLPEKYRETLIQEAWLTSYLKHPNIIKIYDVGLSETGMPFFSMDLKSGQNLTKLYDGDGDLRSKNHRWSSFLKLCDAMEYAHSRGVLHLDLKPENIQYDLYGEVLVCDWGLAQFKRPLPKELDHEDIDYLLLAEKKNKTIQGTPGYMAPEQASPSEDVDYYTDIYALGGILHFLATGYAPHTGGEKTKIIRLLERKEVHVRKSFPEKKIPKSLGAIIDKALAPLPSERYLSVSALRNDMRLFTENHETSAENANLVRTLALWRRRNKEKLRVISIAALTLAGITAWSLNNHHKLSKKNELVSKKSDQLLQEIDDINEEFSFYQSITITPKKQLAERFAVAARQYKNREFDNNPTESVEKGIEMMCKALELDENCITAIQGKAYFHCLQLDFQAFLSLIPSTQNKNISSYLQLAYAFPEFSYNDASRPDVSIILEVISTAQDLSYDQRMLNSMIQYDLALREPGKEANQIIIAYLNTINRQANTGVILKFDEEQNSLHFKGAGKMLPAVPIKGEPEKSYPSVLSYLNIDQIITDPAVDISLLEHHKK